MRVHAGSDQLSLASQGTIANQSVSVIQRLHNVAEKDRKMNRDVTKSFVRCAQFLTRQYIAHTTNFVNLVELVVSCAVKTSKFSWKGLEEMLCALHMFPLWSSWML